MTHHDLNQILEQLHEELSTLDQLSPEQLEKVQTVLADVTRLAKMENAASATADEHQGVISQAQEAMEHFSESHPRLAQAFASITDALSQMGI